MPCAGGNTPAVPRRSLRQQQARKRKRGDVDGEVHPYKARRLTRPPSRKPRRLILFSLPWAEMNGILFAVKTAAATVLAELGPGHSEAVYHAALRVELDLSPLVSHLSSGRVVPIAYKGHSVGHAILDLDFHTDTGVMCILELKAIKALRDEDRVQLQRYRRLFPLAHTVGFLINFGGGELEIVQLGG